MIFSFKPAAVYLLFSGILLNVSPCNCSRNKCDASARGVTNRINFRLKDKITGNDILSFGGSVVPVPDSIKLKDIRTGSLYPLFIIQGPGEVIIYSPQYYRPANVIDSLAFFYGSATPDTLLVYTGLINGWRGDECPTVKEPGITKVVLRNQVLLETTEDDGIFTLRK
jgi:hypothetical protein